MDDNRMLRLIYTLFLGILLAMFVGVGINSFYPPPAEPKFPIELNSYGKELTPLQAVKQRAYDIQSQAYQEKLKPYNRNVSMLTLGAAVLFLAASMVLQHRIKLLADGVMLGGLFSLLYSIGRGFASENSKYVFVVVTIGLVVIVYLGYRRFIRAETLAAGQKK